MTTLERTPELGAQGSAGGAHGAGVLQHKPKASSPQRCCARQLAHGQPGHWPVPPHSAHTLIRPAWATRQHFSISSQLSFWDTNSAALTQCQCRTGLLVSKLTFLLFPIYFIWRKIRAGHSDCAMCYASAC